MIGSLEISLSLKRNPSSQVPQRAKGWTYKYVKQARCRMGNSGRLLSGISGVNAYSASEGYMGRLPNIRDVLICQVLSLKDNIDLLPIVYVPPNMGEIFAHCGGAVRTDLGLSAKLRELLILHTTWHTQSDFLWTSHQATARSVGITDAQLAAIQQDQVEASVFTVKESTLLRVLSHIAAFHSLSLNMREKALTHFSGRELVEIVTVRGVYYTIGTIASVLELESDSMSAASGRPGPFP
jgi:alkylhydroperoxidase family enzyme